MIAAQFPTSADIYLELNGKKLAVAKLHQTHRGIVLQLPYRHIVIPRNDSWGE